VTAKKSPSLCCNEAFIARLSRLRVWRPTMTDPSSTEAYLQLFVTRTRILYSGMSITKYTVKRDRKKYWGKDIPPTQTPPSVGRISPFHTLPPMCPLYSDAGYTPLPLNSKDVTASWTRSSFSYCSCSWATHEAAVNDVVFMRNQCYRVLTRSSKRPAPL